MKSLAEHLKPSVLELGGKSPVIVFSDAGVEDAVEIAFNAAFTNMGQNCCAGTRLYIHESLHTKVIEGLKERIEKINMGDPLLESTNYGPLCIKFLIKADLSCLEKSREMVAHAQEFNEVYQTQATLPSKGYFFPPTLILNAEDDSEIASEEVFGPVLTILKPFHSVDEAIDRANRGIYGLAAGIVTNSQSIISKCCNEINAGTV